MRMTKRPRIVIIGAGFGGLWAARHLAQAPAEVLLLDRDNYHTFFPLLYQVAASELAPADIAFPIRSLLRNLPNVRFDMGEVKAIDPEARIVKTGDEEIPYDYLIIAAGSSWFYFGIPGAAEYAYPLKTLEQAMTLRNHILCRFECASEEPDPIKRQQILTFAIVGGGPTGVEFAGALSELIHGPIRQDFPHLELSQVRIVLLEALDRLLVALPEPLGAYSLKRLQHMGVDVHLGAAVSQISRDSVQLKDGTVIPTETVIWTAGVRGAGSESMWGLPTTRNGQLAVTRTLQVPNHPEIYVVGDLARMEENGRPLPMVAPVAIQQGTTAAQNIIRQMHEEPLLPFQYHDRGAMTTIGRNAAVAEIWRRSFTGFVAWVIWLGVHIFNLVGARNRLIVLINWAWDYFFFERGIRLILPNETTSKFEPMPETQAAAPTRARE